MSNLAQQARAAKDLDEELVEVPQWRSDDGTALTFLVKSMSGAVRMQMLKRLDAFDGGTDIERVYPELIVATAHDPATGERAFAPDDTAWLNEKSAGALERLGQAALRVSGLTEGAEDSQVRRFPGVAGAVGEVEDAT